MFGALSKIGNMATQLAPLASAIPGLGAAIEGIQKATEIGDKLTEAAKSATGADKLAIDKKLGDLTSQLKGDLEKVGEMAKNAAEGGIPQAPQISAIINTGLEALTGAAGPVG